MILTEKETYPISVTLSKEISFIYKCNSFNTGKRINEYSFWTQITLL